MPVVLPPFYQIPLAEAEFGLAHPIATMSLEPREITSRFGIAFEPEQDDLDLLEVALVRTNAGRQFALVRHRHQPEPGTDILTNERTADPTSDLRDLMQAFQLEPHELRWVHPSIDRKVLRPPRADDQIIQP